MSSGIVLDGRDDTLPDELTSGFAVSMFFPLQHFSAADAGVASDLLEEHGFEDIANWLRKYVKVASMFEMRSSSPPAMPAAGTTYLDDGTNTASGNPCVRRFNGDAWVDVVSEPGHGN